MPDFLIDYGHTDEKQHQNLMALTSNGIIKGMRIVTVSIDPPSMATTADGSDTGTIAGLAVGDGLIPFPLIDMQEIMFSANISAANTVEVSFYNTGSGTVNLAASIWRFLHITWA